MEFLSAAVALGTVSAITAGYRVFRSRRAYQLRHWSAFAERYGLRLENQGEPHDALLTGDYRGVLVDVSLGGGHAGRPLAMCTRVFAKHVGAVPPGLEVYNRSVADRVREGATPEISTGNEELDGLICIRGLDHDKTLEVVGQERIWSGLAALFELADYVRVDERGVLLESIGVLGSELEHWVESASSFSVAVCEAYEEPWVNFAQKHGLVYLGLGTPGDRVMRGYMNGGRVSVITGLDPYTREPRSTIKASIQANLPVGFRICRKGQTDGFGTIRLIDKQLEAAMDVQGTNKLALQRLMRNQNLKQTLLAFFDMCPVPVVERGWVSATGPGLLAGDLEAQISAVVAVAQVFEEAWAPVEKALYRARYGPRKAATPKAAG